MAAKPSRIIDSHQHCFWHARDDHGLVADMDEHGIEYAWLLSWEIPPWEDNPSYHSVLNPIHTRPDGTHAGIAFVDEITAKEHYPDRYVLGYCPHPTIGNAPALLEAAVKIHGVKVCGEWKFRVPFDDPRSLELFHVAGSYGLPVVLHLDVPYLLNSEGKRVYQPHWYGGTVANLERALQACPETTFLGHAPGFWREISAGADTDPNSYCSGPVKEGGLLYDLFDRYPNVWGDLSAGSALGALNRDPDNAVKFLTRYQDRVTFARDYYGQDLHQFLSTLDLTQDVTEKIYHQNAERLVKL